MFFDVKSCNILWPCHCHPHLSLFIILICVLILHLSDLIMLTTSNICGSHHLIVLIRLSILTFSSLFIAFTTLTFTSLTLPKTLSALIHLGIVHALVARFTLRQVLFGFPFSWFFSDLNYSIGFSIKKWRFCPTSQYWWDRILLQ